MARKRQALRCGARRSNGQPCRAYAITGGRVCHVHGGAAQQVRRMAMIRRVGGPLWPAVDRGLDRQRRETLDWQVSRVLAAACRFGISPEQVTAGDILVCVLDGLVPGEADMPALRVDGRYGPRSRRQLATRAARQAERRAAS